MRERAPQEGDYWRQCDDARAAGTAPVYRGEPGYRDGLDGDRSEEHTSELQSLMRISYAVFCLKKKKTLTYNIHSQSFSHQVKTDLKNGLTNNKHTVQQHPYQNQIC